MVKGGKKVTYKGVTYPSLKALGEAVGVPATTISNRMKSGRTLEEAVDIGVSAHKVVYKGKTYPSLASLAQSLGLSDNLISSRMTNGKTLEEAIALGPSSHELVFRGKRYTSLVALAEAFHIKPRTLTHRLQAGASLEEAITGGISMRSVTVFGQTFPTLVALSDWFGISVNSLSVLMHQTKCSLEQAVTRLLNNDPVIYRGKEYPSLRYLARETKTDPDLVMGRVYKGWSLADAVERPLTKLQPGIAVEVYGKQYISLREAARSFGFAAGYIRGLFSDTPSIPHGVVIELADSFCGQLPPGRPKSGVVIPRFVYRGKWVVTSATLCADFNISSSTYTSCKSRLKLTALQTLQEITRGHRTPGTRLHLEAQKISKFSNYQEGEPFLEVGNLFFVYVAGQLAARGYLEEAEIFHQKALSYLRD